MSKIETLKATCGAGKREIYIVASPDRLDRWRDVTINPSKRPAQIRKKRWVCRLRV
jgi:Na+-translocating ferredoxin:NAD+ oxidoreductase RnfC subunit